MTSVRDMETELKPGRWNDLERFYFRVPETVAAVTVPPGVQLKVRYGKGWFGRNTQQQTTDGVSTKQLRVSGWVGRARMEAKPERAMILSWKRITDGPEGPGEGL